MNRIISLAAGGTEDLRERLQSLGMSFEIVLPTEARVAAMLKGTSHAPDEIVGLNPRGPFIDRRDARVAQVLRGTRLLDETHSAVHLHAE